MSYSIFRVAKVKNSVTTRALQRHNQRENKNYGNKDIDHSKTHLNYDLINPDIHLMKRDEDGKMKSVIQEGNINYMEKIEERIQEGYEGTRKIRSDAIKHVDGIITSDKEFFDGLPLRHREQYFKDSLEFVKQEYGEKNLLYATVHLDEKTPHMHFGFVPLTEDGRLSAKDVLGNKKSLSQLQDRFNDFVNEKGYNLERGEKSSDAKHIEIMKFKEKTLNEKVSALEKEVDSLQQNVEKVKDIDQRINEIDGFDDKTKRVFNQVAMNKEDYETFKDVAKSGLATLQKYEELKTSNAELIQELTSQKKEVEKERNQVMDKNQNLVKENVSLKQENSLLNKDLARLRKYISNVLENVQEGMRKLSEQTQKMEIFNGFMKKIFKPSIQNAKEEYEKEKQSENTKDQLEL